MAEELGPLSGDKAVGRWVRGKRGTRQISSCISDDTVSWDKVLLPHLVDEGVEILTKVHLQLLYPFHDQETESRGNNVTKETPTLPSHSCSCCLMSFRTGSSFVVFSSDAGDWGLLPLDFVCLSRSALHLCVGFLSPESVSVTGPLLT